MFEYLARLALACVDLQTFALICLALGRLGFARVMGLVFVCVEMLGFALRFVELL